MPTFMRQINIISRCGALYRTEKLKEVQLGAPHHSYMYVIIREPHRNSWQNIFA